MCKKGYGGVAIFWRKELDIFVEVIIQIQIELLGLN